VEKGGTDPATLTSHRGVNKSGRFHDQAASLRSLSRNEMSPWAFSKPIRFPRLPFSKSLTND
jgi:hypothetical protein